MNDYLILAAKRTSEILQESNQDINNLNISATMKEVAREFSERSKKEDDLKRVIREFIS